ncbi:MAG: hypothetical protein HYV63_25265 [Candidatus Schekmanbacteria bacterium]|nr:hypothetical protein [Candidatus Schekmanbacteria bacterium]
MVFLALFPTSAGLRVLAVVLLSFASVLACSSSNPIPPIEQLRVSARAWNPSPQTHSEELALAVDVGGNTSAIDDVTTQVALIRGDHVVRVILVRSLAGQPPIPIQLELSGDARLTDFHGDGSLLSLDAQAAAAQFSATSGELVFAFKVGVDADS